MHGGDDVMHVQDRRGRIQTRHLARIRHRPCMKTLICAAIEVQSVAVKHGHRTIHMTNSLQCLLLDKN